ncbi:biliverdin-producing heme oxygenase [Psychrobacter sp. I-STPA6b]|uniref:biliverdin-producing heme oxygenase n=1 Tax=Psychrobacter sp. I-STPA6b TaxID=2585718 RepID=UPI001D0C102A|nr:biliverdin-producing heme oxygenase [Psychrobacter sp. I-STPA6b]
MSESNQDSALTFSEELKKHSRVTHDSVDELVMSMQPFASVENYGRFLQAQHEFHETLRDIYQDDQLNKELEALNELARADMVNKDMQTLNVQPAQIEIARPAPTGANRLGWLYCAEGSNVGAAILYKEAGKIELTDEHGAAHLAAHPDGRMRHWRAFKEKLDNLKLNDEEKAQAMQGSDEAFAYFKSLIHAVYAGSK